MNPSKTSASRDPSIDTIRGLACMAVVAFHVSGGSPTLGMELPRGHYLHQLNHALIYLRMPVFAMMAGVFWRSAPRSLAELGRETKKRAQHILLPALTVSLLFFLGRALKRHYEISASTVLYAISHSGTYLWFLQSLLTLMLGGMLLVYLFRPVRSWLVLALLIGTTAAYASLGPFEHCFMSWRRTLYIAPYFFLGDLLREHIRNSHPRRLLGGAMIAIAIAAGLYTGTHPSFTPSNLLITALGITGGLGALLFRPRLSWVARLGPKSFKVYLFHIFFTNIAFVIWRKLLPGAPVPLVFVLGLILGVSGPLLMERALSFSPKLRPFRLVLFGK